MHTTKGEHMNRIEEDDDTQVYKRPWVGLTEEEIRDLWSWSMTREAERTATTQQHAFAQAIEAKLREKNS
jgi:hypothetical protein